MGNQTMTNKTVIINATALGSRLSGIGVYILALLTDLAKLKTDIRFLVYLNERARGHAKGILFPSNMVVKWSTRFISPDYGFIGHVLRLVYTNVLSLRYPKTYCFNGSQLEAMFFRTKQILMIHDIIPLLVRQGHTRQYPYFKYALPRALRSAAAVITPSSVVKEHLTKVYGLSDSKIHVIYHGIEHACGTEAGTGALQQGPYILCIGHRGPHKNLTGLLDGFMRVQDVLPHKLVIVGANSNGGSFLPTPGSERIIYMGYVSNQERTTLYRNASLLMLPSFHEGFGFTPLEAMLNGCPVVAANTSSIPEVCGDAAYYVNPSDAESIAEGIRQVATNEVIRNRLIQRGLKRVRMFSWHISAENHVKLFSGLLS